MIVGVDLWERSGRSVECCMRKPMRHRGIQSILMEFGASRYVLLTPRFSNSGCGMGTGSRVLHTMKSKQ